MRVNLLAKLFLLLFLLIIVSSARASSKTYNYCVDPDWMPYEGLIAGEHKGISSEYKQLFESYSGLNFNLVKSESWYQTTEYLRTGKCDLTLILNRSKEREAYLSFTLPYFFGPNVLVTQSAYPYIQNLAAVGSAKLGVVANYRLSDYIDRFHPGINKIEIPSEKEALKALADGEIDIYVGSLLSITSKLKQLGLTELKINGWTAVQDELRIGVAKQHAQALIPVLNQAIEAIPVAVHNDIFHRWSNTQFVTEIDYQLFWQIGSVLLTALLFFIWRNFESAQIASTLRRKNKELEALHTELEETNKKLEFLSYHDNLTGLYNRHYFLTTFNHLFNDVERQGHDAVLMMIDLDYFKQINDRYGHNAGDQVLKEFGQQLQLLLRSGDIAARWGGEEFVVVMPSTSSQQAEQAALRIKQHIAEFQFSVISQLTISVGVSQYKSGDNIHSWLERADLALYEAKASGRNSIKFHLS